MFHKLPVAPAFALMLTLLLTGCSPDGPVPINYGTDQCAHCRMTIADKAFGSEMLTRKGKVLKYDSIECLAAADFLRGEVAPDVASRWVADFNNPGNFLSVESAAIVLTERQKSPMGVGLAAVGGSAEADELIQAKGGRIISWQETKSLVAKTWRLAGPQ